jgi:hypothetical protein
VLCVAREFVLRDVTRPRLRRRQAQLVQLLLEALLRFGAAREASLKERDALIRAHAGRLDGRVTRCCCRELQFERSNAHIRLRGGVLRHRSRELRRTRIPSVSTHGGLEHRDALGELRYFGARSVQQRRELRAALPLCCVRLCCVRGSAQLRIRFGQRVELPLLRLKRRAPLRQSRGARGTLALRRAELAQETRVLSNKLRVLSPQPLHFAHQGKALAHHLFEGGDALLGVTLRRGRRPARPRLRDRLDRLQRRLRRQI